MFVNTINILCYIEFRFVLVSKSATNIITEIFYFRWQHENLIQKCFKFDSCIKTKLCFCFYLVLEPSLEMASNLCFVLVFFLRRNKTKYRDPLFLLTSRKHNSRTFLVLISAPKLNYSFVFI